MRSRKSPPPEANSKKLPRISLCAVHCPLFTVRLISRILFPGRPMRTFTLDEAQSLIPVLESLLKRAIEGKRSAEEAESHLSSLAQRIYLSGGMRVNPATVAQQRA